ncbi:indolepyruvate ferredoxin oxidoreductase family protein [Alcaligenes sp. SDU_A2]|uniref:indolepyruvate ferredoxin oxidoreductase family protein n=1 Tax=Alcaligenes sp. SDU_A2 TaxID=3136634 RepID=UPI00311F11DD
MNAPLNKPHKVMLESVSLDDKYTVEQGRAYMSGTQALVRLPMLQKERDRRAGLNTAGFISGYRGSPLGGVDLALWQADKHLKEHDIVFKPGLNEDLAATAVWGSQQTNLYDQARFDGVFGMWYGKGPGVDRSIDVLKHANSAGSSRHGGVLVLAGDDHGAKSSTVAHQSEHVFAAAGIPVLYPANVQEYLDFGQHGWAISRFSGLWVALKCVTEVVESNASVDLDPERVQIVLPDIEDMPADGLNIRWPDPPLVQEARMMNHKWYAALAYVRANKLNRIEIDSPQARFGIMTAGKAYLDTRQALADLGLSDALCAELGIRLFKVGCIWPLDAQDARQFATGLSEILVIEEKRQVMEYALKEELYNWRDDVRPKIYGKFDETEHGGGEWSTPRSPWLLPAQGELSPAMIARAIARRLTTMELPDPLRARIQARLAILDAKDREARVPRVTAERKPWFCSGCPHNTSTRVPEGSRAMAGIGCHYMTIWMDRSTSTFSHMGGEGVAWIGQQPFTNEKHVFANLGDGTYFHSGILAIRASIAANSNITYKILYNDAVAMTGGQPVDGILKVTDVIAQVHAEGAKKIVVVTDEPEKFKGVSLAGNPPVYHRDELDRVQRELRDVPGTTVLVYDQTCATEKRRRRKKGTYPDPALRAFINDTVCEGCGDCSVKSNCLSVEPLETPLGTKRTINQSSCNKDFSCVNGFCPSFVTLKGAQLRKPQAKGHSLESFNLADLPLPTLPDLDKTYGILIAGIGGTGVVTVGGLLGMAAHLENKGVTVLDMAGLAQKGGAVLSHVQIARQPDLLHATRVPTGEASLLIGSDALVSASTDVLSRVSRDHTRAIVNTAASPTSDLIGNAHWKFPLKTACTDIENAIGSHTRYLDANALAVHLMGDALYANPILLGYAFQRGWIPLHMNSLLRAIELNGVAVHANRQAFQWGRLAAAHGVQALMEDAESTAPALTFPESVQSLIKRMETLLSEYQNPGWARRYREAISPLLERETELGQDKNLPLTRIAATQLARLMSYKDEYEVARLYTDPAFLDKLRAQFAGEPGTDYQIQYHLAPPILGRKNSQGQPVKSQFGPSTMTLFRFLARLKGLRGTPLDVFGYSQERRHERQGIEDYLADLAEAGSHLTIDNLDIAQRWLGYPELIRGYGHVKENGRLKAYALREQQRSQFRARTEPHQHVA